jgi:hypothetical protein
MNIQRLLSTPTGKILISILLGIGLACLFGKTCTDGSCIRFEGAVITEIHEKVYKHDEKCYQYVAEATRCNTNKKIIDVASAKPVD